MSLELFSLALEGVFQELNWNDKGINNDIVLITYNENLKVMVSEVNRKSKDIELKMNISNSV